MAGIQDIVTWSDDFIGGRTIAATVGEGDWKLTDTSAAGAPTCALVTPSANGELAITLAATSEVENMCVDFGNVLAFDIDNLQSIAFGIKVSGCTTGTILAFGLQSARNDDTDATTNNAQFKMVGATSTTALFVETDDNVTDVAITATGATLSTTYKHCVIDFTGGKSDVKFYVDGSRVAASTTFTMASATGSLQPFVQISKAANTNVDAVTIDYVEVCSKRL